MIPRLCSSLIFACALTSLPACAKKPEVIKITASSSKTLTLKGTGTLGLRLEIHQLATEANTVAWLTWMGENPATVTSSLTLYRFDTSKPNVLHNVEKEMDLEIGKDGSVSTKSWKPEQDPVRGRARPLVPRSPGNSRKI